jgi:catechol 2,3-dioxygenase
MTIGATLQRLVLSSPQVESMASFYAQAFDYDSVIEGDEARCEGSRRSLWIRRGAANQLLESHFAFPDAGALDRYEDLLESRGVRFERIGTVVWVRDPDGRKLRFEAPSSPSTAGIADPREARLQHYAVRTPEPRILVDHYANALGFTVSDLVLDEKGDLTAAFLRTDAHHHSLAIFRAPERRFDHFSCETCDWNTLRDWADHLAGESIRLHWGVGRHGPGNDTFFMVLDPDGNLAEISSDLELCAEDRAVGTWKHAMETLNQWGVAIMRS